MDRRYKRDVPPAGWVDPSDSDPHLQETTMASDFDKLDDAQKIEVLRAGFEWLGYCIRQLATSFESMAQEIDKTFARQKIKAEDIQEILRRHSRPANADEPQPEIVEKPNA